MGCRFTDIYRFNNALVKLLSYGAIVLLYDSWFLLEPAQQTMQSLEA